MARKKRLDNLPTFDKLLIPTIQALIDLGGSGNIDEINGRVYEIAKLSDEVLQVAHSDEGAMTEIDYRLAWSRTYLKKYGLLENSSRGVWTLSKADINIKNLDASEIKRVVQGQSRQGRQEHINETVKESEKEIEVEVESNEEWRQQLLNILYTISPAAFERLLPFG